MEDTEDPTQESFADVVQNLQHPLASKRRDPRSIRLAAVVSAVLDIVGSGSDDAPASQVYAKAITALEGTLTSTSQQQDAVNILSTQSAVLELLLATIPHVHNTAILAATLPLTSRILRAIVSTSTRDGSQIHETAEESGGVNALLRWVCRFALGLLQVLPAKTDVKAVQQFFAGTMLQLFQDRRPKVRKLAHSSVLELLNGQDGTARGSGPQATITKMIDSHVQTVLIAAVSSSNERQDEKSYQDLMHLFPFLERSILHLNFGKLGGDLMEFLAALLQPTASSTDFVSIAKVRENSTKVMTIGALLSVILVMLQDDSPERSTSLDEFAPRVLASLLQVKLNLVLASGSAETQILIQTKTVYGQVILAACSRIIDSNSELACKLFPLAVQSVVQLSRPNSEDESIEDSTNVANTLLVELTQVIRTKIPTLSEIGNRELKTKCLQDLLQSIAPCLDVVYADVWTIALKTLAILIQQIHHVIDVQGSVQSLIELHGSVPRASQRAVEGAIADLIQGVGMEDFWKWVHWVAPASKSAGVSSERAWILATMKVAAMTLQPVPPRLSFFQGAVLGLARNCDKLAATGSAVDQKGHRSRVIALWSLFPCFCKNPEDVESTLPSFTATLTRAVDDKRYPELRTIICNGISALVSNVDSNGGFKLENASADVAALGAASVVLLPVLFKFVTDAHSTMSAGKDESMDVEEGATKPSDSSTEGLQNLQCVTTAISSLSRLAPEEFLHGLFKKLMHRLLEEIQADTGDKERICSLLTLSQALVAAQVLDESSVSFLYRAVKPMIRNDEDGPRVQKRAYKVLTEICERYHSFVAEADRLQELSALLSGTVTTSQISSRHMRLKCLNIIVDGLDMSNEAQLKEIYKVIPEILLCLKDSNGKTRDGAYQLLLSLASRADIVEFLKVIVAALGAKTSHMRSAVVMALSRIVFEQGWENDAFQALLPGLLKTVLVLIDEGSREVTKSVVGFIRISVAAIAPTQLEPLLPDLVGSLLKSQHAKTRFRAKIKIILKKLVKSYGYETLMPFVPDSEKRLLTHMRKLGEREKRKKQEQRGSGKPEVEQFDALVDSDEDDSDDGRTYMTGMTGKSRLTKANSTDGKSVSSTRTKQTAAGTAASKREHAKVRLPDETDGNIVDMLDSSIAKRVQFADDDNDSDSDAAMEFDDDGKLLVPRDDVNEGLDDVEEDEMVPMEGGDGKRRKLGKNGHDTKRSKGGNKTLGASYKSKKAGGDVQKKGQKFEPYAFVPLDGRSYSKKNRRSAVEQMSSVVRKGGKRKR